MAVFSFFQLRINLFYVYCIQSFVFIIYKTFAVPSESCSIVSFDYSKTVHTCNLVFSIQFLNHVNLVLALMF